MDRGLEAEVAVAMTKRIVALLCSLAGLAERTADRSPAMRCLVLGFLRLAESAARKMVIRDSLHFGAPVRELAAAGRIGAGAADAMRLARRFRELALALESLAALIAVAGAQILRCRMPGPARTVRQTMGALRLPLDWLGLRAVIQHDTS